jgi:hypothetical protein
VLQGARPDLEKFTVQVNYSSGGENGKKIQSHWTLGGEAKKAESKKLTQQFSSLQTLIVLGV